jgi:hypothetical protein
VGLAALEIDLVGEVDGIFRARAHAALQPRAKVQVDRVFLHPVDFEGAEPAGDSS